MSRYIDADKLKEFYKPYAERKLSVPVDVILLNIDDMPIEDVQEVKHGRWIETTVPELYECSVCGCVIYSETEIDRKIYHKWCGRCGAKIDLQGDIK